MISNIDWLKLYDLMRKCWIENNAIQSNSADPLHNVVVSGSIPILWFGDIEDYANSPKRVITIGINPSRNEFGHIDNNVFTPNLNSRIPISNSSTVPHLYDYIRAMAQYFRNNPLMSWFWPNETALNACDSTYGGIVKPYNNANISNVGLHIDIVAPLATNPWESLNPSERNALTQRFNNVFIELVEALDPDILISPVKLSTYFSTFNGTIFSSKAVTLKKSGIRSVNKMLGNIGGRCRVVIEGWNGPTPFPFADKSVIYSAIH